MRRRATRWYSRAPGAARAHARSLEVFNSAAIRRLATPAFPRSRRALARCGRGAYARLGQAQSHDVLVECGVARQSASSRAPSPQFAEPSWAAPLDVDAEIAAIPEAARVRGLLIAPMLADLKKRGWNKPLPRERYVGFNLYPLREHARLLVDTCQMLFPDKPVRESLRKLGRAAPSAFGSSTLGKVTLGAAEGVQDIVSAFAKGYELNLQPGRAVVTESHRRSVIVSMQDVHYFIDSHHVGAFEGALKRAGLKGQVLIARRGRAAADFLLQW